MRKIGLHIRIPHHILDAAHHANQLDVPIFQIFFIDQIARKPLSLSPSTITSFKTAIHDTIPYVHASYFINLAHLKQSGRKTIEREMTQAKQIGASALILHPGSATGHRSRKEGLDQLIRILNTLIKQEKDIRILLENTAHGGQSIGSNIDDLAYIKQRIDYPEKIAFCIDTAHAHTYGYNLNSHSDQNEFINLLDKTIETESIQLIHLNDSYYDSGSRIDKHAPLGQGTIGDEALRSFILHPALASIPIIMELPVLSFEQEDAILQKVKKWHIKKESP